MYDMKFYQFFATNSDTLWSSETFYHTPNQSLCTENDDKKSSNGSWV